MLQNVSFDKDKGQASHALISEGVIGEIDSDLRYSQLSGGDARQRADVTCPGQIGERMSEFVRQRMVNRHDGEILQTSLRVPIQRAQLQRFPSQRRVAPQAVERTST